MSKEERYKIHSLSHSRKKLLLTICNLSFNAPLWGRVNVWAGRQAPVLPKGIVCKDYFETSLLFIL